MTLSKNIADILEEHYPLDEMLDLLANLALQRSSAHKQTMSQLYNLIIANEEGNQGYVYYTPQSFTFVDDEYQPQESQAEFSMLSEHLGNIIIENSEDRDYLDGVIYACDLTVQATKPSSEDINPYQRTLDEYEQDEYADENEIACGFDEGRNVWILIRAELTLTPGVGFDEMVDEAVEFVTAMEEEGYVDDIAERVSSRE